MGTGFAVLVLLLVVPLLVSLRDKTLAPSLAVLGTLVLGFPIGGYLAARMWLAQYGLQNEWGVSLVVMQLEAGVLALVSVCLYLAVYRWQRFTSSSRAYYDRLQTEEEGQHDKTDVTPAPSQMP